MVLHVVKTVSVAHSAATQYVPSELCPSGESSQLCTAWVLPDGESFPVDPWQQTDGTWCINARCVTEAFRTTCDCELEGWWNIQPLVWFLVFTFSTLISWHHVLYMYITCSTAHIFREHLLVTVMGYTSVKVKMLSAGRFRSTWQRYR